ncbi:hypothetical protein QL285_078401 [Trifolium repens]|nr:hypothetical protein QL285_078401 [Trifolium repens]
MSTFSFFPLNWNDTKKGKIYYRNESFSECAISFTGTNLIAVGIKSSMHRQQVCSVPGSIEALTREIERDPKVWFEKCDNLLLEV